MFLLPDAHTLGEYYEMGGFVMLPLILVAALLWYGLVYRLINVKRNRLDPRTLIRYAQEDRLKLNSVTAQAAQLAIDTAAKVESRGNLKSLLNEEFSRLKSEMNHHRSLVRSLVMVAPLLGLLGTVDGMIETFNSLGDMALFSQTGGIAGGISRALFTTQMGLAISIPGLLIGRMLERRQININRELDQIRDLVCARN